MDRTFELAVRAGDAPVVRSMLKQGVDVNSRDSHGQTALLVAARLGHTDVVEALIAHGADLDASAKYHLTALMLAVLNNHQEIARRLVAAGANRSLRGSGAPGFGDKTAYDLARERGDLELAALLRVEEAR